MKSLREYLDKKLALYDRKESEIKAEHGPNPSARLTYHAGQTYGYWQGKSSAIDGVIGFLEQQEDKKLSEVVLSKREKEIYLQGYLKAKVEDLSSELKITEEEAKEILINGLKNKIEYDKKGDI